MNLAQMFFSKDTWEMQLGYVKNAKRTSRSTAIP
jgi:hypothetical protein